MKSIVLAIMLTFLFSLPVSAQICDETGSYNEIWTKQARAREDSRDAREKYYSTLTADQLSRISDFEIYPTSLMTCGMGFSNGLARIRVKGKIGFIDASGRVVIKPKFVDSGRFSEGLAPVEFNDHKWGYIDKTGRIKIQPAFDWALIFREGLALVQVGKKWGFIDKSGKTIVSPQFDHANSFSDGLAHVQIYREKYYSGYIDKTGKLIIPLIFNGGDDFFGGSAVAAQDVVGDDGNYKYTGCYQINKLGNKIKEVECSRTSHSPTLLDSNDNGPVFEDYKTGYKSKTGKYIWKPTN